MTILITSGHIVTGILPSRIVWTPNLLVIESLASEEQVRHIVTLVSNSYSPIFNTGQLRVVAEGNIAPYLAIKQPVFPDDNFYRGQSVTFEIVVSVPKDALLHESFQTSEGKLVLKRFNGSGFVEVWTTEGLPVRLTMVDDKERVVEERVVVNQFLLALKDGYSLKDAEDIASLVNGRVIRSTSLTNLYVIKLETATLTALNEALNIVESDPRVDYAKKEMLPLLTSFDYSS